MDMIFCICLFMCLKTNSSFAPRTNKLINRKKIFVIVVDIVVSYWIFSPVIDALNMLCKDWDVYDCLGGQYLSMGLSE